MAVAQQPLSGSVDGFAPNKPADPSAIPVPTIKTPKGEVVPGPAPDAPPPPMEAASAPDTPAGEMVGDEQSVSDVPGNPFTEEGAANRAPAATEDAPGNPFADPSPAVAQQVAAPLPIPAQQDPLKSTVQTNLAAHAAQNPFDSNGPDPITPKDPVTDFVGGFEAGLQISVAGLGIRGKMPSTILPEQADMAMRIGKQIGMFAGDLPAMLPGLVSLGASVAAAPATGGISLTAAAASSAEAFALPVALRKIMIDHYEKGDITTARDFAARTMATSWEAVKAGATGAATAISGGMVIPVAGKLAGAGAELVAMTTVGSALEGHLPSLQDFIDGAFVIGGLHGVSHLAGGTAQGFKEGTIDAKLKNIFAETGESPQRIVELASKDVELKQQLIAGNAQEPPQATPTKLEHSMVEEPAKTAGEAPTVVGSKTELVPKTEEDFGIHDTRLSDPELEKPAKDESLGGLAAEADARAEVLSKIGESGKPKGKSFQDRWDSFYAKHIDYLDPLNVAIEAAKKGGAAIETSAYDLGRILAAQTDKVRSFLEFGTRDATTGKVNGEGLNQIMRDVPDGDLNGYRAYAMAKRALELDGRGITPWEGFNPESTRRLVDATAAKFEEVNQRRIDFSNRVLDYAQAKGLFSADQIAAMKEANKNYIPFNRAFETNEITGTVKGGSAIKEIFGSEREIVDPILQTFKNTEMIMKRALVNEVRVTFTENLREGGLLGEGLKNEDLTGKFLNKIKQDGPLKDTQIAVFHSGERVVYEGSPGVIDTLKRLDGDRTAMEITTKVLRGFTNAVRIGVTSNPAFGFAHFFRSQVMSGVYSKTGMVPFIHPALSLMDFFGKSEHYQQWLYDGGASGSYMRLNETYLKENKVYDSTVKYGALDKAWNVVKSPFHVSEAFIRLTDNLSRFTEYKRSIEQGAGTIEATMRSRDVVPDYARIGLQRSVLRQGVAFIGAHINSLVGLGEAIQSDPTGVMMKLSVISGMSAALWAVNKDDEAIEALPDWQKNTYWNINISRFSPGYRGPQDATILRLPKPWAPGILFGSGAELALDEYYKDHPKQFGHFMKNLTHSVLPEVMPNMLQPMLEQYANKQSFSGRPLVNQYQEKLLPEMQYTPYTSETAKAIGKLIGYVPLVRDFGPSSDPLASPAVVENYIKSWGGTLGGWALKTSDYAGRGFKWDNGKADPWENTAFIHQFVSRYPSFQDQRIQDFYDNKNDADKAYNSFKLLAKQGDYDAAQALAKAHPDFEMRLTGIAKGIGTARKTFMNVQEDPSIPDTEKRQVLDSILFQIASMAKEGNKMMSDFKHRTGHNNSEAATTAGGN